MNPCGHCPSYERAISMIGLRHIRPTLLAAGFCAATSLASAQSEMGVFALSLHEQLDNSNQPELDFGLTNSQINDQLGTSIIFLLDAGPQTRDDGLRGLSAMGSGTTAQRGRSQQGLHSFSEFMPKEDTLNIVPLPSAALAGFGLLAGVAGVRYIRKIKN